MAPTIRTTDERAVKILDAARVLYELDETQKPVGIEPQENEIDYALREIPPIIERLRKAKT